MEIPEAAEEAAVFMLRADSSSELV